MGRVIAERTGVCDGNGYQNLGWSGMSQLKCFQRAADSNSAGSCAFLSFAPSYNDGQTGCWCFPENQCENIKSTPDGFGGDWATFSIAEVTAGTGTSAQPADMPTSTPAPTSHDASSNAASASREISGQPGWCERGDRSNIAFGGMSQEQCLAEAMKRQRENNGCPMVSYSSSAGPQHENKFCQCIRHCEEPLVSGSGETWQTLDVPALIGSGSSPSTTTSAAAMQGSSTIITTSIAAPTHDQSGWCTEGDRSNIAFGGMTRELLCGSTNPTSPGWRLSDAFLLSKCRAAEAKQVLPMH